MNQLNNIYKKNGIFTLMVFTMGFSIPYIQEKPFIQFLVMIAAFILYLWNGFILAQVIKAVSNKKSSIHELKFLYITLCLTCAAGYFYFGIIDSDEKVISGLRVMKDYNAYGLYTFEGAFDYFIDICHTYLNSIYYSVVVMGTLGDSVISVKGGFARFIVGFEVVTTLAITVFKIGEYFSDMSSREAKMSERIIVSEIQKLGMCSCNNRSYGVLKRSYVKLKALIW
ncbi:hypothetical protein [Vibrio cholerae]|uniref:hypothetical protein n=1 Tax=Vibrio cholerae TaxID=666 RepID=UPI00209413BA|nr:hypothetical protein [Vibrio cholerae]MCO7072095.1 hypothetical protein [Vibrio cholerae]